MRSHHPLTRTFISKIPPDLTKTRNLGQVLRGVEFFQREPITMLYCTIGEYQDNHLTKVDGVDINDHFLSRDGTAFLELRDNRQLGRDAISSAAQCLKSGLEGLSFLCNLPAIYNTLRCHIRAFI